MAALKVAREEDCRQKAQLEKEVDELQDYVIEQLGFDLVVQLTTFFYKIPTDEGNFDPYKAFHNGELLSLEDIPDEAKEEAANKEEAAKEEGRVATPSVDVVNIFD